MDSRTQLFDEEGIRPIDAQECLQILADNLLDHFVIIDPVSGLQANSVIVYELLSKYDKRLRRGYKLKKALKDAWRVAVNGVREFICKR